MKKSHLSLFCWSALAFVDLVINFVIPAKNSDVSRYHLSNQAIHWVDATILIPSVITLFLAYWGFESLRRYSQKIADNPDGQAFKNIGIGIGIFAYGSLVSSIISTSLKWIAKDVGSFNADATRISNYLSVVVILAAFWFVSDGIKRLMVISRLKSKDLKLQIVTAMVVLLGVSYSFVTFHQTSAVQNLTSGPNIYYLPAWLVLFTVVLPYVLAWAIGLFGIAEILAYRRKAKGIVYRSALDLSAQGLGMVLLSYITLDYLSSLSNKLDIGNIGGLLIITYLFLIVRGLGYFLIIVGARKLRQIEEV